MVAFRIVTITKTASLVERGKTRGEGLGAAGRVEVQQIDSQSAAVRPQP